MVFYICTFRFFFYMTLFSKDYVVEAISIIRQKEDDVVSKLKFKQSNFFSLPVLHMQKELKRTIVFLQFSFHNANHFDCAYIEMV